MAKLLIFVTLSQIWILWLIFFLKVLSSRMYSIRGQLFVTRLRSVVMGTQASKCGTGTAFCSTVRTSRNHGKSSVIGPQQISSELCVFLGQLLLVLMCSGVLHIPDWAPLISRNLPLYDFSACFLSLSVTYCSSAGFNFTSGFITFHFWSWFYFCPCFHVFDFLHSSSSTPDRCWYRSFRCRR